MTRTKPAPQRARSRLPVVINVLAFGLVLSLFVATPFVMTQMYSSTQERALAGDMFGTVNALFSGLAFAGLIVARTALNIRRRVKSDDTDKTRTTRE